MKTKLGMTVAIAAAAFATSAMAQDSIGVVKRSQGHVILERSSVQIAAAPGTEVQRGDRVITGPNGRVSIAMRRAAPINVGPDTNVALDRFAADERVVVKRAPPAILRSLASFLAMNRQQ